MQTLSESVGPSALQIDCPSCGAQFQPWKCGACGHVVALDGGVPRFAPDVPAADDGYDPNYFERMAAVEPEHFWFRNRNALLSWALRRFFPSADNLLEIGCGTGFVLSGLSQSKPKLALYGSELHVRGLDFARRRLPDAQFFQMDARQLPFRSAFDVVGAFDVLEHIDEDQMVLEQLHEAVRPGGGLMLTVPQHSWLWSSVDDLSGHKRRYASGELSTKVKQAGFDVVLDTSFVSVLLPLLWATRKTSRAETIDDVMAQFDVHPVINAALHAALRIEQVLVRTPGVRLPWGASGLVVARRPKRGEGAEA